MWSDNDIDEDINKFPWSEEEDELLVEVHKEVGNNWTKIAEIIHWRSEDITEKHWNATKRRVLLIRAKRRDALPPRNKVLENYIRTLAVNNNLLMDGEDYDITTRDLDVVDGVKNLNLNAGTQTSTTSTVMDASTTLDYVPGASSVSMK